MAYSPSLALRRWETLNSLVICLESLRQQHTYTPSLRGKVGRNPLLCPTHTFNQNLSFVKVFCLWFGFLSSVGF